MRVLVCGDAVVKTGFARCTHAACDALHAAGHEVEVVGINYFGRPHPHPYGIWSAVDPTDGGRDIFGVGRTATVARRFRPDVVVLLNDPWNVPAYLDALDETGYEGPVVGWLAVDGLNQHGYLLNRLTHVVTWTRFGLDELRRGGYEGTGDVVPLGVDLESFHPGDRAAARQRLLDRYHADTGREIPADAWIVGRVDRNQPRKRWDLTLQYFSEWRARAGVEHAYLYVHTAPTGEEACDIGSFARYYGIADRILYCHSPAGGGVPDEEMREAYLRFDIHMTTTQGEGWGLPTLEAMACGTPGLVPDFAALGEWPGDAALKVPCGHKLPTAPMNGALHTLGAVPDGAATVEALDGLYRDEALRARLSAKGLAVARALPWSAVGRRFVTALEAAVGSAETEAAHG